MTYTQCGLRGLDEAANQLHTAWLPSKFAVVGKVLRIDGMPGQWEVRARYESRDAQWVEPKSRDHLKQREASDV